MGQGTYQIVVTKEMKIVLDTNILLQSLGHSSRFRTIWKAFLDEVFDLHVTASILFEYEEQLTQRTSEQVALNVIALLTEAPNVYFTAVYYEWNAITADYDDNKFFDAAVAGNVDYLVTNDAHFNTTKKLLFPRVNIISAEAFLKILSGLT